MKKLDNNGFGIISLLIALSAIMILTVMTIPIESQNMTNTQITTAESTILNLQTDVFEYANSGGTLSKLGVGYQTSTPYGLQSATYNYLVPVSWNSNSTLNASYPYLTTQDGWYNVPNGSFATAYLATAGNNVFAGSTIPQFALGLYAPTMTNAQAATVVNYIESKENTGAFNEFIWNGQTYRWNATNHDFENSSNLTVPTNNSAGNGQLIFGFNGYIQTAAITAFQYTQPDPIIFNIPGEYQWTVPAGATNITITCAGAGGGDYYGDGGGWSGGSGAVNSFNFNTASFPIGSQLQIYVGKGGGSYTAPSYYSYGFNYGASVYSGGGGSSGIFYNGFMFGAGGGGGGGGGNGSDGVYGCGGAGVSGIGGGGGGVGGNGSGSTGGACGGWRGTIGVGPSGGEWSANESFYTPAQDGWVEISW